MLLLASFCDIPWFLSWLLPFLLGLLLGWWLWARYRSMVEELEDRSNAYQTTLSNLENQLSECKSLRADLEADLALAKRKTREMETERDTALKDLRDRDQRPDVAASGQATETTTPIALTDSATTNDTRPKETAGRKSSGKHRGYAGLRETNLQIVEGIGPKMESVLKENKITTWSDLANHSPEDLRGILDKYGTRYQIINPESWTKQAELAEARDWPALVALQKALDGGNVGSGNSETAAKVEKMLVRLGLVKKYKENDLKVIEGIGPKIAALLENNDIKTWKALASTTVDQLESILEAGGSRFQLADPTTWPKQADMAAKGLWADLEEYQDYLQGGKE